MPSFLNSPAISKISVRRGGKLSGLRWTCRSTMPFKSNCAGTHAAHRKKTSATLLDTNPSIHGNHRAGDVSGGRRREENGRAGHVVGPSDAPQRAALDDAIPIIGQQPFRHLALEG